MSNVGLDAASDTLDQDDLDFRLCCSEPSTVSPAFRVSDAEMLYPDSLWNSNEDEQQPSLCLPSEGIIQDLDLDCLSNISSSCSEELFTSTELHSQPTPPLALDNLHVYLEEHENHEVGADLQPVVFNNYISEDELYDCSF